MGCLLSAAVTSCEADGVLNASNVMNFTQMHWT